MGIYNILYECDYKSKCGHKMYHVQCMECGWETDMMKGSIARASKCTHIAANGIYINYDVVWKNKRIGKIFQGMKQRCYNPNEPSYRWYGAKGIKICDEWFQNPNLFEEWAISHGYSDNLTIDRIDENCNYSPDNCRWTTGKDNAKYKSTTSLITANNETHTGKDWSKILGFGVNTINTYIRRYGLENTIKFIEAYLKNPTLKPKHKQSYYDLYMTIQN